MAFAILGILLLALIYAPTLWVRFVMRRHKKELANMPGTGGELAQHLIERFGLNGYQVQQTDKGDHFNPAEKTVCLSADNFNGKSLTAVAVAAHEVGHALQCHKQERIFKLRSRYLPFAVRMKRIGILLLTLTPLVAIVLKNPAAIFGLFALGIVFQLIGVAMYLIVLPEEWDASFNKALPMLMEGEYIRVDQLPAVRQVLKAAALTYLAGALADVLNIARWLIILLRR